MSNYCAWKKGTCTMACGYDAGVDAERVRVAEAIEQLQEELNEFVMNIPRRERTVGDANMASVAQHKRLCEIMNDFREALGFDEEKVKL